MQVLLQRLREVAAHHPDTITHNREPYSWIGYHGTNDAGAHSIRTEGIKPSGRGDLGVGFYTSHQLDVAVDAALLSIRMRGGAPEIVNIYVAEQAFARMNGFEVPEDRMRVLYDPAWTLIYDYVTGGIAGWEPGARQLKFNSSAVQHLIGR